MSIDCAVLMCHAPIVIPAIAGGRAARCAATTSAMMETARHLVDAAPEVVVIISPHAPRRPGAWGIFQQPELHGDFGRFGAPHVSLQFRGAPVASQVVAHEAREHGLTVWTPRAEELDHGTLVPLFFVREAGWTGPVLLISLPYPGTKTEPIMGMVLRAAALAQSQRWCVLASGDMSHRLTPDAPAGYHERAADFDRAFVDAIRRGNLDKAWTIDTGLRDLAAEDVVDSVAVAAGAVGFDSRGHRVINYEAPFGVGYLEAILFDGSQVPQQLCQIAREAVIAHALERSYAPPRLEPPWGRSRGVFVTIRTTTGDLRGCIGRIEPRCDDLATEIAQCARLAASSDPRFPPVVAGELELLVLEVSLLDEPEPIDGLHALDPACFGVVVQSQGRRGILLPNVTGISSVEQQVRVAAAKGGIDQSEPHELLRFRVRKAVEPIAPKPN